MAAGLTRLLDFLCELLERPGWKTPYHLQEFRGSAAGERAWRIKVLERLQEQPKPSLPAATQTQADYHV